MKPSSPRSALLVIPLNEDLVPKRQCQKPVDEISADNDARDLLRERVTMCTVYSIRRTAGRSNQSMNA